VSQESSVRASDIMTAGVITVTSDTPIQDVVRLLLKHRISAVPVLDDGTLLGLVSEGDLLRRGETDTERRRPRWLEFATSPEVLAAEYVKSHARTAAEVMTSPVITVTESTPIAEIADLLESRGIKRVPVLRDGTLVGIVSRANLLQAFASMAPPRAAATIESDDAQIREALTNELGRRWAAWPTGANFIVQNGEVHLWGLISSETERRAMILAAESVPGVKRVEDHLGYPGLVF